MFVKLYLGVGMTVIRSRIRCIVCFCGVNFILYYCLQINSSRIEKEVINRQSFAGIALAHADASVELRNRLESAQVALQQSQVYHTHASVSIPME